MAGGKTLIGGTAYDINKGKTLINGTAYDVNAGKTLIGGTAYDISFRGPSLFDLFSQIEILTVGGRDSDSRGAFYINKSSDPRTQYLFVLVPTGSVGTSFGIYQVKNGAVQKTIYRSAILYNGYYDSGSRWYYASTVNASSADVAYGGTIALITFPSSYDDTLVESLFAIIDPTTLVANGVATIWSNPSLQLVSTTNKDHQILLCCRGPYLDFRYGNVNNYTIITSTSTTAANVSGSGVSSILSLGYVYVGSILYIEESS